MTLQEWKVKHRKGRSYAHFDAKVSLDTVWNFINDPIKVATHSFYPFIHFPKKNRKMKSGHKVEPKIREIYYSAHLDRYIYQYYSFKLNQLYNERIKNDGIDHCAIAYRDNLKKNNIHFAKEVFDFIRASESCYIIVGDFTKFFDRLDHKYLKRMLCNILGVSTLSDDYYAVYKNITHYSFWEMESILQINGLENKRAGYMQLNKQEKALTSEQFRSLKKTNIKLSPDKDCGIPQGSAISAILSNIYMLEFDRKINTLVSSLNGIYMRYSDDFVIVIPLIVDFKLLFNSIFLNIKEIPRLDLQLDKTRVYRYDLDMLKNINSEVLENVPDTADILNYLGFSFDGKVVTIRDKTITKYYYRMNRKLKTIIKAHGKTKTGKKISCKNLYRNYTIKGANTKQGNFITYVARAKRVFGDNEAIDRGTKRHLQKIRHQLNKI